MNKNKIRLDMSMLSNRINAGRAKETEEGYFKFIGEHNDVTEDAIRCVVELMANKCNENGVCEFVFEGFGELKFTKHQSKENKTELLS